MRVLLDECLPRDLKVYLSQHDCRTVQEMGWSGKKNGTLAALAEGHFDVLPTIDQRFSYRPKPAQSRIAIFILTAPTNKIEDLAPLVHAIQQALQTFSRPQPPS